MRLLSSVAIALILCVMASTAVGQGQPPPQVPTTVQLPTFSFFTVQTTVSVPDSGGTSLGGISRGSDGSTTRGIGPLRNRGLASTRGASGMSIHARIIDNHEMDEAILAQAAAKSGSTAGPASSGTLTNTTGSQPFESVAAIRARNAAAAAEKSSEAAEYFAKAQKAEAAGKTGAAKIYYQMVMRRDAGSLKEQAQARLAALAGGKAAAVAAR